MISGLYASTRGLYVTELKQAIPASNLANVAVPGYRRQNVAVESFSDILQSQTAALRAGGDMRSLASAGAGLVQAQVYTDRTQGTLRLTGQKTDFALEGDGFFAVSTPEGVRYTRNGSFVRTLDGTLQFPDGSATLLDTQFNPIRIPPAAKLEEINLEMGNRLTTEETVAAPLLEPPSREDAFTPPNAIRRGTTVDAVGVIGVWEFSDEERLTRLGGSLYEAPADASMPPEESETAIRQGFVEQSNVDVTREMVDLITTSRSYEQNQRVIQTLDRTLEQAVNDVARI